MVKKRGLGKGLDELLGNPAERVLENNNSDALKEIAVDLLQRGQYQPRRDFNKASLQELADSITAQGIIQPIVVRGLPRSEKFEIIAGERRWRAAQLAGLKDVPVVIKDVPDKTVMCIALIENIQREDLNPVEEGLGLKRLRDEFGLSQEQVADVVGRSRSAVANLLRLLNLENEVLQMLERREINTGHAKALLGISGGDQIRAAREVINADFSVRQTEALIRRWHTKKARKPSTTDPNVQSLQQDLSSRLGAEVRIKHHDSGSGRLEVRYSSLKELDGILHKIR